MTTRSRRLDSAITPHEAILAVVELAQTTFFFLQGQDPVTLSFPQLSSPIYRLN